MSKTIELQIPDEIYERAEAIAKESNRSLEAILNEVLAQEFRPLEQLEIETELKVLALVDDEMLWAVLNFTLAIPDKGFRTGLRDFSQLWLLNKAEKSDLERAVQLVESCVRLRLEVQRLLDTRGWNTKDV